MQRFVAAVAWVLRAEKSIVSADRSGLHVERSNGQPRGRLGAQQTALQRLRTKTLHPQAMTSLMQACSRAGSCEDLQALARKSRSGSRSCRRSDLKSRSPSPARARLEDGQAAAPAARRAKSAHRSRGSFEAQEGTGLATCTEFDGRRVFVGKVAALGAAALLWKVRLGSEMHIRP